MNEHTNDPDEMKTTKAANAMEMYNELRPVDCMTVKVSAAHHKLDE